VTDNSKKVSQLPVTTNVASSDRLMVLYNANNTSANASVRTIAVNNFINSIISGPFSNDSAATTGGVSLGQLYYDSSGFIHIRLH